MEKYELISKRIYQIIKANGGTSRWPNLYAVCFEANWMDGDSVYINLADDYYDDPEYEWRRPWGYTYPSYWGFYTTKMTGKSNTDEAFCTPCIAFEAREDREESTTLKVKVMQYPYFFEIGTNHEGDEYDLKEKEINVFIEKACQGLSSFEIDNSDESEEKLCMLLDILQFYVFLQKLADESFVLEEPRWDEEKVDFDNLWLELWDGYEVIIKKYFEEIILDEKINGNVDLQRRAYILQRLGLVYAYMAVVEDADWLLRQIKDIQEKEGIAPNGVTLLYLKEKETSLTYGDSKQILKEIFDMSE